MEPIPVAIIAAQTLIGASVRKKILIDAYTAFKNALRERFGHDSELLKAVDKLEQRPDSSACLALLKEEIEAVQADQDPVVLNAAQNVVDVINTKLNSGRPRPRHAMLNIQPLYGNYNYKA